MLSRPMLRVLAQVRANGFEVRVCEWGDAINILICRPELARETSFGFAIANEPAVAQRIARDYLTESQRRRALGDERHPTLLTGCF